MLKTLVDLLFPPLCHHCRVFIADKRRGLICDACLALTRPVQSPLCLVCGVPFINYAGKDHTCGDCLTVSPRFSAARAPFIYEGAIRDMIHSFKYNKNVKLRRPLAILTVERMAGFVDAAAPQLIVPVPLHLKKLRQRSFNQSVLLAEVFSKEWELPLLRRGLTRIRPTEPQVNLAAKERAENVKGAFSVDDPTAVKGKRILLVDDVLTTGSTLRECAKELKRAGAETVHAITVARVPLEQLY